MKKLFLGLGIIAIAVQMVLGWLDGGFLGLVYGVVSGVFSGGIFIGIAVILDKLEMMQQEIRYAGENARAALLHTVGYVRCKTCGHTMTADYSSCPICGSGEIVGEEKHN